jgi:hypothetical protein
LIFRSNGGSLYSINIYSHAVDREVFFVAGK